MREAESFEICPSPNGWWNFWHVHPDLTGIGNHGTKQRLVHLSAALIILEKIHLMEDRFHAPFQSWIILNCQDSSQDAVFLHTPNPNSNIFPALYPEIQWDIQDLDSVLEYLSPGIEFRVGRASGMDLSEEQAHAWSSYFIYRLDTGIALVKRRPNSERFSVQRGSMA